MRKRLLCLFVPLIFLSAEGTLDERFPNIEYSWDVSDDSYLFLDIELDPAITFDKHYGVFETKHSVSEEMARFLPSGNSQLIEDGCPLKDERLPNIECSWDTMESVDLLLAFERGPEFTFGKSYRVLETKHSGSGVKLRFLPSGNNQFIEDGCPLIEVVFTMIISYDRKKHSIEYLLHETFIYESRGWFVLKTRKVNRYCQGTITNIDIDLSKDPEFILESSPTHGYLAFKKER